MAGIIVWAIVLFVIISNVKKNQKSAGTGVPKQANPPQRNQVNPPQRNQAKPVQYGASAGNQEELKRRLMEKYAGRTMQQPVKKVPSGEKKEYSMQQKPDILAKASANVAEDFEEEPVSGPNIPKADGMTEAQIVKKADELAEVDLYKVYDVPQLQQESELMKMVSDIMAKGVDTEPAFSRDFVAEGLDMINNMTF